MTHFELINIFSHVKRFVESKLGLIWIFAILIIGTKVSASSEFRINFTDFTYSSLKIGKIQKLVPHIKVFNGSGSDREYEIKLVALEHDGFYYPLPDYDWIKLSTEFEVSSYDEYEIKMEVKITKNKEHYNRKWIFGLMIGEAGDRGEIDKVGLVKVKLETEPLDEAWVGTLVAPHEITITGTDSTGSFNFWLWNSEPDSITHIVTSNSKTKVQRKLGYTHEGIDISFADSIFSLGPGESRRCYAEYQISNQETNFESLIFIRSEKKRELFKQDFIRLLKVSLKQ